MGAFISYMIQVSLVMAMLYVCYKALLSSATFHAFKRFTLLGVIVAAWLLPLAMRPHDREAGIALPADRPAVDVPAQGEVEIGKPLSVGVINAEDYSQSGIRMGWVIPAVYMCGLVCVLVYTLLSVTRLACVIRRGDKRRWPGVTIVINDRAAGPFSWGRYVVIRQRDCDEDLSLVITHELNHMHRRHWIDTMLAQLNVMLLWFNPFSYMIMRELKCIHEFEADMAISPGQRRRYQLMLIKKTVGSSFPTFANSLNHSQINKRITMMMKRKSSSARRLAALALPGAAALSMFALSQPAVAHILAKVSATSLQAFSGNKVSRNSADEQILAVVDAVNEAPLKVKPAKTAESKTIIISGEDMVMETATDKASQAADESVTREKAVKSPAYFVDGRLFEGTLAELNPSDIKSVSVVKNDPEYPEGKIMIELKTESDDVVVATEHMAGFKGGTDALMDYLSENVVFPKGLSGKVRPVIQFTVGVDGSVSDLQVVRSGGEAADAETIRVLSRTSHMWEPAIADGKPVASKMVIPIVLTPK